MTELIKRLFRNELIRFILIGGINTLMGGILIPFLFRLVIPNQIINVLFVQLDLSLTVGYILWFTFAYLLQVHFVFQTEWSWPRFALYPLTQIPNYGLNQFFLWLFERQLEWPSILALGLSAILPIPIMFLLVRYIVKKPK
jgi:putative flippase GtrA